MKASGHLLPARFRALQRDLGAAVQHMSGRVLVKLNLITLDPSVQNVEARVIGRVVGRESDLRGWPDGWYEDPSALSDAQLRESR